MTTSNGSHRSRLFNVLLSTLFLVQLTGPGGQAIELNPAHVVSLRAPRISEHFATGTRCLITTTDGRLLTVQEPCVAVQRMIEAHHP